MRLHVVHSDKSNCFAGLHGSDAPIVLGGTSATRHFCRPLRLEWIDGNTGENHIFFTGWSGGQALAPRTIEFSAVFALSIGLAEGDEVQVSAVLNANVATGVMIQPSSVDDWEVVELQAEFIEEHLLGQIAVLSPGMVFPVWTEGRVAVKLCVDARDENVGECFLLDRDTELMIESKQRAVEKAVFADENDEDHGVVCRVVALDDKVDVPVGHVNPHELEALASGSGEHCLVWVVPAAGADGATSAQLLRIVPNEEVPPRHIVVGVCFANNARIPCFGLIRLRRCHQRPVFVPHIELLAQCEPRGGTDPEREDEKELRRRFETLVRQCGELELLDGAVIELKSRDSSVSQETHVPCCLSEQAAGPSPSEETDLYDGLSDIEDIYGPNTSETEDWGSGGVYEVDLSLDEPGAFARVEREGCTTAEKQPVCATAVTVCVRFVVGPAVRASIASTATPPYVRLTPRCLTRDVEVSIKWSGLGSQGRRQLTASRSPKTLDAVSELCARTPGLQRFSKESCSEFLRVIPKNTAALPLDGLSLFASPARELRDHVVAQLGCYPRTPCEAGANEGELELVPTSPTVCSSIVPGIVAVLGARGAGKTSLCRRVCADLAGQGVMPLEVTCAKLAEPTRKFTNVQGWLSDIFQLACWHSPSVVLLDDFGALCPDVEKGQPSMSVTEERSVLLAEQIMDLLLQIRASCSRLAVVVTLPSDSAAHRILWRALALEHKVALRPPQLKDRPEILQIFCRQKGNLGWELDEEFLSEGGLDEWGGLVDGFSVADLQMLVDRACIEASVEISESCLNGDEDAQWHRKTLSLRHLQKACQDFTPATMTDQTFFTSEVRWSDVGGLQRAKRMLIDMLTMSTKYAVLVDRAPVRGRKGIMLVGPPGCGKTFLVHAAANETKGLLRFLTVKGPELLSKYIGASEAGVRQVFERAAAAAPAALFFDEIEALAPRRGGDSTGVTDRVVNQMLCYLDGVEDRGRVYVIAATSRPDLVDAALMRPGRFDKICYCGLPSKEEKLQICEVLAAKHGLKIDTSSGSGKSALLNLVSAMPRLFTSADIGALFSSAKIEAVNGALEHTAKTGKKVPQAVMGVEHLHSALALAKASISEADERRYSRIFAPYMGQVRSALHRDAPEPPPQGRVALA